MILKQSTARNLTVWMADSTDHITGKSGLTLTITASKDGAAFSSISPTVTDLGSGWYNLALTTTHTNTLGALALHVTSTGADPTDANHEVCVDLPGGSVASVSGAVGSVSGLTVGNLDVAVSTRLAAGSYTTPPTAATIAQAVWDALTSALTTVSSIGKLLVTNIDAKISSGSTLGGIRQNVGVNGFQYRMFNDDGTPGLNLTITGKVSLDGGAFTDLTNASVEIGNGWYKVNLANADVNGKVVALKFNGGTGVQETPVSIVTDT